MRVVSKIVAALVFIVISMVPATPLAAAFVADGSSNLVFLAVAAVIALAASTAPTARRAWGRVSLLTGLLFVALPFSMVALSGRAASDSLDATSSGAEMAGVAVGAGLMVGASAFIGLFAGAIFVILGLVLVLGGRREVIVVQQVRREPVI